MAVDKSRLRRVFGQIAQEHPRFRNRPADDRAGMGRQEQEICVPPGIELHKPVANRPEMVTLLGGEIEEADRLARIDQRVLANEILDFAFRFVVERVIRRRMSANSVSPPRAGTVRPESKE